MSIELHPWRPRGVPLTSDRSVVVRDPTDTLVVGHEAAAKPAGVGDLGPIGGGTICIVFGVPVRSASKGSWRWVKAVSLGRVIALRPGVGCLPRAVQPAGDTIQGISSGQIVGWVDLDLEGSPSMLGTYDGVTSQHNPTI